MCPQTPTCPAQGYGHYAQTEPLPQASDCLQGGFPDQCLLLGQSSSQQSYSWAGQLFGHTYGTCTTGVEKPAGLGVRDIEPHPRTVQTVLPNEASQGLPNTVWLWPDSEADIISIFGDIRTYKALFPKPQVLQVADATLRVSGLDHSGSAFLSRKPMPTHVKGKALQEGSFLAVDRKEAQGRSHKDTCVQGATNVEGIPEDQDPLP